MFTERKKLNGEIEKDFDHLAELEPYDEKYAKTTENLSQLYDLKNREDKNLTDLIVGLLGIGLPLVFYGIWMNRGFKFEETGAYTSTTFRGLFNRFKPTK